jgi:hypothetical protein
MKYTNEELELLKKLGTDDYILDVLNIEEYNDIKVTIVCLNNKYKDLIKQAHNTMNVTLIDFFIDESGEWKIYWICK